MENVSKKNDYEITGFKCVDDLSGYVDSLLFPSGTKVACMTIKSRDGFTVDMELAVKGEVYVIFQYEVYRDPAEFPPELIQAVKNQDYEAFTAESNNWFELEYTFKSPEGDMIACDNDVWEPSLQDKTPETLKEDMLHAGTAFAGFHMKQTTI